MSFIKISKAYIGEILSNNTMIRIPEPNLLMNLEEQVDAYAKGGEPDGSLAPIHYYAIEEASKTLQKCKTVLDLGIGSGYVISKMALVNPHIHFTGIDLSEAMLEVANKQIQKYNLKNVTLIKADITKLEELNQKFDGVMSTLALHHLPTVQSLHLAISQSLKVMATDKVNLFFFDLGRLKKDSTIRTMLELHPKMLPYLIEDAFNSQKAAFTLDEFKTGFQSKDNLEKSNLHFKNVFLVPYLLKIHSSQSELTPEQKYLIKTIFNNLSSQNKGLVRLLRLTFI